MRVWQDEVDPQVHRKNGGGVMYIPEGTDVEEINSLDTSRDNCARSHNQQARQSEGDRGQDEGW